MTQEQIELLLQRHAQERSARERAESPLRQKEAELAQKDEALRKLNERLQHLIAERKVELVGRMITHCGPHKPRAPLWPPWTTRSARHSTAYLGC